MIRQGPSWRIRNKDTYYSQERRSDMTINLNELRDELLDSTPVSALVSTLYCSCWAPVKDDQQVEAVAADYESSFTFDVDGLSDEALDVSPSASYSASVGCACGCEISK